ncbi:acid-sensing ion channel 1 [Stomoxys calcitrans]|uniref:Uncharacterized protein n=1 Tax=Stomoxys calcitrans TaxID=35570 RepID=A0A1I8P6C1_STOCA|nr:acid-sensing ion channel 1 [Stomoxys calcitrans]
MTNGKRKYVGHLKDYCVNSTLAGFSYIANSNLHIIERVFWLICVLLSAMGSYVLISQFESEFNSRAVSIVLESLPWTRSFQFPTIAVCELQNKKTLPEGVEDYVESLVPDGAKYNDGVEDFMSSLVFAHAYIEGKINSWCTKECQNSDNCAKCPETGWRMLHERFRTNCSDFFVSCELSLKPFECCAYFLPLITPHGNCFMLNSLLNNKRGSPTWFNNKVDPMTGVAKLKVVTKKEIQLSVLNEEDLPQNELASFKVSARLGQERIFQIFMHTTGNDAGVREIPPEYRNCRFPDELIANSAYRAYSISTCFFDCLRFYQMKICNCSSFYLMPEPMAKVPDCDLEGFRCLNEYHSIRPATQSLLPWSNSSYSCHCMPSCNEIDFKRVYENEVQLRTSASYATITVNIPELSTERFRRQAMRTRLDIVVTIGGILGLFLGASILSGIELVYYFTLRWWNN